MLREEIEADPDWGRRLMVYLSAPSSQNVGSVVITGSRVSGSHISLGPLTVNNTPGGRALIAAAVVLVLALVTLGTYGAVQVLTSDGSPRSASTGATPGNKPSGPIGEGSGPQPSGSTGPSAGAGSAGTSSGATNGGAAFPTEREAMEVLPTEGEVPSRLEVRLPPKVTASTSGCATGVVTYTAAGEYEDLATFRAEACGSTRDAEFTYEFRVRQLEHNDGLALKKTTMAALGDERVSYQSEYAVGRNKGSHMIVRVGRFVLTLTYGPISSDAAFPQDIESMIRAFVENAQAKPVG
ncbi:hypothetical protein ACIPYQ_24125 [Streptomyces sp. NPDC090045]|uniref:hypothetical protein n=1 Tax=Streptomyces sp. NPDC090045 TaxID=3365927 RepID=UPI0037F733AC